MKKTFTILIAALMLLTIISQPTRSWGQTKDPVTIYSENFGTPSSNTNVSDFTGWSATSSMFNLTGNETVASCYSGYKVGTGNASTTSDYSAASGGGNAWQTGTANTTTTVLTVQKINISGKSSLAINFAIYNGGAANYVKAYYQIDNGSETEITLSGYTNSTGWHYVSGSITGTGTNLKLIFKQTPKKAWTTRIDDILLTGTAATTPTLTVDPTSASAFTYSHGNGPSASQDFTVTGSNLSAGITVSVLSANNVFEISSDNSTFGTTDLTPASGDHFYVRLKTGLAIGNSYSGTVTISSTGANSLQIALSGTVTAQTYTIEQKTAPATAHGTINFTYEGALTEGKSVTLSTVPADGYEFTANSWKFYNKGTGSEATLSVINNAISMPAYNLQVDATFTAKTTYEITKAVTPANSGTITADADAWEGKTVNVSVSPAAGYVYSSITIKKTADETVSVPYTGNATDGFTFTMPAYAVTITATFTAADIYAKYSGELTEGDYVIYYSNKVLKNTVSGNYIAYEEISTPVGNQIVDPSNSLVWHISKTGDYWTIYNTSVSKYAASTGAKNRGTLSATLDNKAKWSVTVTNGDEYDFENLDRSNGSDPGNKWLRENTTYGWACYSTSTGGKLTLYKKVVTSTMAVASVNYGTITATPAGGSAIAEGGSVSVASGKTITLNATANDGYVLEAWDVYKTGYESTKVTVTNNAFTMPEYDVTVSASFRQPTTYTAQFSVNGEIVDALTQSNVTENSSITLPLSSHPSIVLPSGYVFAGWTDNPTTCAVISGSTYQMTSNKTFYLVFIKSGESLGYKKVEVDLGGNWAGDYLIAYSSTVFADGRNGGTSGMGALNSSVDPDDNLSGKIVALNWGDTYNITLEEISYGSNTYVLKTQDGRYNYQTSNSNGLASTENKETAAAYPITVNFDNEDEINLALGGNAEGAVFRYNSSGYFRFYKDGGQEAVYLYKKTQVYTRVSTISDGDEIATINPNDFITVPNGATFTLTGSNNGTAANLIIEDGGQLILHNSGVQATIKKTVTASAKNPTNWYTIASPVRNVNIGAVGDAGSVNNLKAAGGEYDLYRFNETKDDVGTNLRWENYKNSAYHDGGDDDFIRLETGRGYLYRRKGTATLEYVGEVNGNEYVEYSLTVAGAAPLTGFHLIGNPYSHDIYKGTGAAIDDSKLNKGFYRLTNGTAWTPALGYGNPIHSGEGILVQANDAGTLKIYNSTASASGESKYNNDNIMFSVANSQHEDVTYAVFDKGHGLNKIEHRDDNIPMLYISQNGENYAIAMMSDDTKTFDLSLKVKTMGQYTLSYKTTGEFSYLHVIDRLTGEDVDMLLEGEYSFVASPNDSDARFIVKLAYLPDYGDGEGDIFAYQNGSDIFVSGEGELQIFDVMGRFVMSERINGVKTISADELSKGVYVLRLVGNGMKTQKIVVK